MFSNSYKGRVRTKYSKYRQENTFLLSALFVAFYVIRDGAISILMWIAEKFISNHLSMKKEVVFLESRQQGYGDLLFQTPIFEALSNSDYKVDVVISKKHLPIIEGSSHIRKVYFWNDYFDTLTLPFRNNGYVVFLGRNTIIETIFGLMFYKSEKIILDRNLKLWKRLFSQNHTIAWQELIKNYLDKNLKFDKPKIYIDLPESKISKLNDRKKIAVIAGVDKKEKKYAGMFLLINLLGRRHDLDLYLIGACDKEMEGDFLNYYNNPQKNLINKQSYSEVISFLSSVNAVIGTEGSLAHVSTTLGVPTVVIEGRNKFWKYSNLEKTNNIVVVSENESTEQILHALQLLLN